MKKLSEKEKEAFKKEMLETAVDFLQFANTLITVGRSHGSIAFGSGLLLRYILKNASTANEANDQLTISLTELITDACKMLEISDEDLQLAFQEGTGSPKEEIK